MKRMDMFPEIDEEQIGLSFFDFEGTKKNSFDTDKIFNAKTVEDFILRIKPLPQWTENAEITIGMMYKMLKKNKLKSFTFLVLLTKNKLQLRKQFSNFHQIFIELIFQIKPSSLRSQLAKMDQDLLKYGLNYFTRRFVCLMKQKKTN